MHLLRMALLAALEATTWSLLFVRGLWAVLLIMARFAAFEAPTWSLLISRLGAVRFGMPLFSALKASSEKENQDVNKLKVTL